MYLTKMETIDVTITDLAHGGFGIARHQKGIVFVPYGLPGDILRVKLEQQKKGVLWAQIQEVLEPSPERVDKVPCPFFGTCGGCTWLHFRYPTQLEWKKRIAEFHLQRIGHIHANVIPIEDSQWRLGYRTRAKFHSDGKNWGFFARNSHRVVPITSCPLCHSTINSCLEKLRLLKNFCGSVEITAHPETGEVLVWTNQFFPVLSEIFTNVNFPNQEMPRACFTFDNVPVVNGAFSQSSLLLNRILVRTVHSLADNPSTLLDLYCGSGNFSLRYATTAEVVGLDHNEEAVQAAGALGMGIFKTMSEEDFGKIIHEKFWDVIILDPPRTGAKSVVSQLAHANTRKIIYVSCDPATFARDAGILSQAGWTLDPFYLVDMFPHTYHIEIVAGFHQ